LTSVVAKSRAAGNLRTWISAEIDRLAARSRLGLASAPDLIGKLRQLATQAESLGDSTLQVDVLHMIAATAHDAGHIAVDRDVMGQLLSLVRENETTTS